MRKSDITKQKILKAAGKAFAERGFYGASVNDIADAAGVNKRMIYAHFESKEKLYISVLDDAFRRLSDADDTLLCKSFDCTGAVLAIVEHFFVFFKENKYFVKLIMRENLNEGVYFKKTSAHHVKSASLELLRSKIRQGAEDGVFKRSLDADQAAFMVINICLSCFSNACLAGDMMQKDFEAESAKMCATAKEMCMSFLLDVQG